MNVASESIKQKTAILKVTNENSRIRSRSRIQILLVRGTDPRIRICTRMSRIRNTDRSLFVVRLYQCEIMYKTGYFLFHLLVRCNEFFLLSLSSCLFLFTLPSTSFPAFIFSACFFGSTSYVPVLIFFFFIKVAIPIIVSRYRQTLTNAKYFGHKRWV